MIRPSRNSAHAGRRRILLYGVLVSIVIATIGLSRPAFLDNLDRSVYDTVVRAAGTTPPAGRVVIVDVDERSLGALGQWPWRRDLIARLVARIRDLGASVVALDIIFAEPDRDAAASPDAAFAETLRGGRAVLGYAMTFDAPGRSPAPCVVQPLNLAVVHERSDEGGDPMFEATGMICSLPELGEAAGASGFLNAAPDADGILRRVPLVMEHGGRVYPSLALRAVAGLERLPEGALLRVSNVNAASLQIGGHTVPLDARSNLLVRYRGKKGTFPFVSAADVLSGQVAADAFRGRIVLVGTTALGTREVVATPLDTLFTGVEVQATVADNLLQGDFIRRQQSGALLESFASLSLAVLVAIVLSRTRLFWSAAAAVAGIGGLWCGAVWLLAATGVFMSPLFPTVAVVSAFGVMTLAKSTMETRRADRAGAAKVTAQQFMVQTLLSLTETRDAETGRHSRRTQLYARCLAERLAANADYRRHLTPERIELLASLAPLHDIGKVGVPDHILNKPGALTPEELVEMRKHPVHGRDVILKAEQQVGVSDDAILAVAKDIVYTHHEKWDGTGYPQGLRGAQIPVEGRVMAVVDVYDAVVARNLYKPAMTHDQAVAFISRGRGTHFDPAVVDAFVEAAPEFRAISQLADG